MEGVTAGLRDSGSCEHCSRQCRSAHAAVPAPAGHADLQAKGDNGISSKPFFRQERAETLRLVQTSKVWGSSGAACKTHAPTSSTCPPALLPEADRAVELSIEAEAGVKRLLKVQDKPGPGWAFAEPFIESLLSVQAWTWPLFPKTSSDFSGVLWFISE